MKKINALLYSGGLDSLCIKTILEEKVKDLKCYYFQFKGRYDVQEVKRIQAYNELTLNPVNIIRFPLLDKLDTLEDYHVPLRNLELINRVILEVGKEIDLTDKKNYQLNIYFNQILEVGRDKNNFFFKVLEMIYKNCYCYNIKILRPFNRDSKYRLIKKSGLDRSFIDTYSYSCYEGGDVPCNICAGCLEREKAFQGKQVMKFDNVGKAFSWIYIFDLLQFIILAYEYTRTFVNSLFDNKK